MSAFLGAMLPAASGGAGPPGLTLAVPLVLMVVLVALVSLRLTRRHRHSPARRDNPPSEPDGSKAQPPARRGGGPGARRSRR